jgi:hypothetical protein
VFGGNGVAGNTFTPSAASIGNNSISYSYTNLSECISRVQFTVVLSDTTLITRNSLDTLICISEPAFIMNNYASPVGGSFSGNGVSGSSFDASVAGTGVSAINYTFTNLAGCQSSYAFNLSVGGTTAISKSITDTVYCNDETAFSLNAFVNPGGGVFSGSGVTGNNFDPAIASIGMNTIQYEFTNSFGCVSRDSFQIRVDVCSDISNFERDLVFNIFPNPSTGSFSVVVTSDKSQTAELIITDALGKVSFSKPYSLAIGRSNIFVELPGLSKGVYAVQLKGEKQTGIESLIIE